MSKIICGVTNCYLNKNKSCCASSINVEGKNAINRGSTCCSTFGERQPGFSNSTLTPQNDMEISCSAENCIHNENRKCKSQTIQVHGDNVSNSSATFCTTFRSE